MSHQTVRNNSIKLRTANCRTGFALLEMLAAVVVAVVLMAAAIPQYFKAVTRARATEAVQHLSAIRIAQEVHRAEHGSFAQAPNLIQINETLELELTSQDFDFVITSESEQKFLAVATSQVFGSGGLPFGVTIDETGAVKFLEPEPVTGGSGDIYKDGVSGPLIGGGGGGSGGGGGGGSGGGGIGLGGGGSGGSGGSGGGSKSGTRPATSTDSTGGSFFQPPDPKLPTADTSATTPNIPTQENSAKILAAFNALDAEAEGTDAKELADFLVLYQIELVFEAAAEGVNAFVELADATKIHLAERMLNESFSTNEIAAVLAHEAKHIQQLVIEKIQDDSPVYQLETIEGPAYAKATLVWDELRRDGAGNITEISTKTDLDFRALFIIDDDTVDTAALNAYLVLSRSSISANNRWW